MSDEARIAELRAAIAAADRELIEVLERRLRLAGEIGEIKRRAGRPVMDPAREAEVVRRAAELARERGVDPELVRDLLWRVIAQARGVQEESDVPPASG